MLFESPLPSLTPDQWRGKIREMRQVLRDFSQITQAMQVPVFQAWIESISIYLDICQSVISQGTELSSSSESLPLGTHELQYWAETMGSILDSILRTREQKTLFCQLSGLRPKVTVHNLQSDGGIPVYEMCLVGGRQQASMDDSGAAIHVFTESSKPFVSKVNGVYLLREYLKGSEENLHIEMDEPMDKENGGYFLDATLDAHQVTISWIRSPNGPEGRFGVSCREVYYYGEGDDEIYGTARETAQRVLYLLRTESWTATEQEKAITPCHDLQKALQAAVLDAKIELLTPSGGYNGRRYLLDCRRRSVMLMVDWEAGSGVGTFTVKIIEPNREAPEIYTETENVLRRVGHLLASAAP